MQKKIKTLSLLLLMLTMSLTYADCPDTTHITCWNGNHPILLLPEYPKKLGRCTRDIFFCKLCDHTKEEAKAFCREKGMEHGAVGNYYFNKRMGPVLIDTEGW